MWCYVKAHVYTNKPASFDALEDNIETFTRDIPAELDEPFEAQSRSTFTRNNLQTLNYMEVLSVQIKISGIFVNFMFFSLKNFSTARIKNHPILTKLMLKKILCSKKIKKKIGYLY